MTTRVLPKATETIAEINALIERLDNPCTSTCSR